MQDLVTALKQTSRRGLVAATGAAAALTGISFASGMQINQASVLQTKSDKMMNATEYILFECRSEHSDLMAEREKLLDELKSRQDGISKSLSPRLKHVVEPWHLHQQKHEAWCLQRRAISLFNQTCDADYNADSETDVATNIPEHIWQGKLRSAMHLISITSDQVWW